MHLDLTQEQVARAVGFAPEVYGRVERGDMMPSVPKLWQLCLTLRLSADVLLSLKPREASSADKPTADEPGESPELRRLIMLVCELPPDRFRLFRILVRAITHPDEQ
jgi:transcriptional regulator with XRE-family HTH domain